MQTVPLLRLPTDSNNSSKQWYGQAGLRLSPVNNAHFTNICTEQQVMHTTELVEMLWRRATLPNPPS